VRRAKGHADRPLSEAELFEKFRTCLDAGRAQIVPDVLVRSPQNIWKAYRRGNLASVG